MKIIYLFVFLAVYFFNAPISFGEKVEASPVSVESSWLSVAQGFKGERLGAEVVSVFKEKGGYMRKVHISIPREEKKEIEEVLVIGRRGDVDYTIKLDQPVEVIRDFENGRSGIVIHLGEKAPFKLLINYIEHSP